MQDERGTIRKMQHDDIAPWGRYEALRFTASAAHAEPHRGLERPVQTERDGPRTARAAGGAVHALSRHYEGDWGLIDSGHDGASLA